MLLRTSLVLFVPVPIVLASCGSGMTPPTMQGREGMLSKTAVHQKCEAAAQEHERPFVVEWDATDLASFEAKAARDTVFVAYEGCTLRVLDRCSDQVVPGKFGAYGTPHFTSGTMQGFEVKDEGELYTKLPLGAANLSGRVHAGEQLHLRYFVSGVAQNTRDAIYDGDVKSNSGCAGATHFVWAYNLGAFELSTTEHSAGEANASVGSAAGVGGKRSHDEASIGAGGKLAACETQDQRGCRVPIRLALRKLSTGENPVAASPAPAKGDTATVPGVGSAVDQANALLVHAKEKFEQGDGASCLDSANRAMGFDSRLMGDVEFKRLRARCLMVSGKCDEGKRDYRAALAEEDRKREKKDFQLDAETREASNELCGAVTATSDADYVLRAYRELKKAAEAHDGKRCRELIDGITERGKRLDVSTKNPDWSTASKAQSIAGNAYEPAAKCVAEASRKCADGLAVMKKQCSTVTVSGCLDAVQLNWPRTVEIFKIACK